MQLDELSPKARHQVVDHLSIIRHYNHSQWAHNIHFIYDNTYTNHFLSLQSSTSSLVSCYVACMSLLVGQIPSLVTGLHVRKEHRIVTCVQVENVYVTFLVDPWAHPQSQLATNHWHHLQSWEIHNHWWHESANAPPFSIHLIDLPNFLVIFDIGHGRWFIMAVKLTWTGSNVFESNDITMAHPLKPRCIIFA